MITVAKLRRKPRHFQAFTGVSVAEFDQILAQVLTQRIYVEHHFARLQKFGILGGLYWGRFDAHEDVFCIVSGLLNFRATGRFSLA